jgi:hypothetical protein
MLIGVNNCLESMAVHAAALMPGRNVGQTMCGLEMESAPYVCRPMSVQIYTLRAGALYRYAVDPRHVHVRANVPREILVGRKIQGVV